MRERPGKPIAAPILLSISVCTLLVWPLLIRNGAIYYQVLGMACLYATLAIGWNIHGLTGAISLGHAAFFGLGAYGSALLQHYFSCSVPLAIVLGAFPAALYGIFWSLAFNRLRGAYLALATLASVEIPKVIIDNWDSLTHGSMGLVGIGRFPSLEVGGMAIDFGNDLRAQYYLLLFIMFLAGWMHRHAMISKWGWAIRSGRENETAASMLGVNVFRTRLQALLLSAYLTGICGALYAHLVGLIEPALVFNLHLSGMPLVMSLFGGRYQFYGPILGGLLLYPVDQLCFHPWLPAGHTALYGLMIILTILFSPRGIGAWLQEHLKSA
jgi:branched-chain amino acid transport system permease protein